MLLLVGDDWAEEHHDVEVQDEHGRVLGKAKLPEGIVGIDRLHALIGQHVGDEDDDQVQVVVGIETDRGPWVQALLAAGYRVYPINPLQVARYRERHSVSGAKSDPADAHTLADMVRTDRHQLRPAAGDSAIAEAVKVITRAHKTLIWERQRHTLRLRSALLEFFPEAVAAFASKCATMGQASLPPNSNASSKPSIAFVNPARKPRARALASPSPIAWSNCTAASSLWIANSAKEVVSISLFPLKC